jgi:glycosyltransferase involved in cell wall biosynthesis
MTLQSLNHAIDIECILDIQDDGSNDESIKVLSNVVDNIIANNKYIIQTNVAYKENKGLIKARNESYDRLIAEGCEYIAIIHNDMMFARGMFSRLIHIMNNDLSIGILAAETLKILNDDTQKSLDDMQLKVNAKDINLFRGNNHPAIMRVSALKQILEDGKVYDESFGKMDNEDTDCMGRLEDAGYKTLVTTNAWAYHQGEASRSAHPEAQVWKDRSHNIYMKKWAMKGKKPWEYRSIPA